MTHTGEKIYIIVNTCTYMCMYYIHVHTYYSKYIYSKYMFYLSVPKLNMQVSKVAIFTFQLCRV